MTEILALLDCIAPLISKYGPKVDVRKIDASYSPESTIDKNIRTDIYQVKLLNKEFALPLNVVITLKTNLESQAQAHVILFSTDLELSYDKLIKFYSLRFQIEIKHLLNLSAYIKVL